MNVNLTSAADLYYDNVQRIKSYSVWKHDLAKRLAALLFTAEGRQVDSEALRKAEKALKQTAGPFSPVRGTAGLMICAVLALSEDPQNAHSRVLAALDLLKHSKFRSSDYLAVAAGIVARQTSVENLSVVCARAGEFLSGMKQNHPYIAGQDDYAYAALLALSDLQVSTGLDSIEKLYGELRYELRPRGSVYNLCQVLALDGKTDQRADQVRRLRSAFRSAGLKLDKANTLVSIGILSLIDEPEAAIVGSVQDVFDYLRHKKGMGSFSVNKDEMLLTATTLTACILLRDQNRAVAAGVVSSAITKLIIAQQATSIVTLTIVSAVNSSAGI